MYSEPMKFVAYSRATMMAATPTDKPWGLISVCEKGNFPEVHTNDALIARLNLQFHDVDFFKNGEREDGRILFSREQAEQVIDFYLNAKARGATVIYVHCLAGQCRSAAIAAALDKIENGDDHIWFRTKRPNMRVFRGVMDVAADKGLL